MKNLRPRLVELFQKGYCTPLISQIAKEVGEASTTIHYNVKQMEKDGTIKAYKAVFDNKKIDRGFCVFLLVDFASDVDVEKFAKKLISYPQVESIDLIHEEWELLIKIRAKDMDEYYEFTKKIFPVGTVDNMTALNSVKQLKSEFVEA